MTIFRRCFPAIATSCLMMAALAFPSQTYAQVNAEQVLAIGRNVLSMEDYMLAIQYFNQAIKAKPYLADPYFFRALAKLSLDDYKGAEEDCNLAIERNKFKTEAYKLRGFARQNLGLDSLAVEDYDVGLEYNPLDKYFLFYKAVALTELEKFDDADSTFTALLRHYPKFEEGFAARGRLNTLRGDTVAALADLDRSLELSKSLINPYLMRAEIEWRRRQWEAATADINEAVRLAPDRADLYVNRAFLRYNSDDYFGAMSDYNYALELDPSNSAALFNRGLLRYEVKDLDRAAADFSAVLEIDPGNFHALYNRGLVYLEAARYKDALQAFETIARQYPRFYPAYYAIAEARRGLGDMQGAMRNVRYADSLVEQYVTDPDAHPLDRPTIAAATDNSRGSRPDTDDDSEESRNEVMERFNRLVTVSASSDQELSYNEKIKGRVQDRNVQVEPEPMYVVTFARPEAGLRGLSNYFRDLDDLNAQRYLASTLYLSPGLVAETDPARLETLFKEADAFSAALAGANPRPVDWLGRGVVRTMLKDFDGAIADLDMAVESSPRFAVALMARGFARYAKGVGMMQRRSGESDAEAGDSEMLHRRNAQKLVSDAIADFDAAIAVNPRLVYAWFNKGNIYYALGDYTSALQCYAEALSIDPGFGQAYFNRGLAYLQAGNRNLAFSDLSKAGELGVLPSYNLLKRMAGR